MPPTTLFDLSIYDLEKSVLGPDVIRAMNPQRGDMEHLDGICHVDDQKMVAFKHVRADEFWVPGHIPGRPLMPGVVMIEAAAQAASFFTKYVLKWEGFIGFGGVNDAKFRQSVSPPCKFYVLTVLKYAKHRRVACNAQGIVNGQIVFEAEIIGAQV